MPYEVVDGQIVVPAAAPETLDAIQAQVSALYPVRKPSDPGVSVAQLRGMFPNLDRVQLHAHLNELVAAGRVRKTFKTGGAVPLLFYTPAE